MQKLTPRQMEYLRFFAERDGKTASITAAAEQFKVAKSTVSQLSHTLTEMGLIRKKSYGVIELTDLGRQYVMPRMNEQQQLVDWMTGELGMPPVLAEQEARKMITLLQPETVEAILCHAKEACPGGQRGDQLLPQLPAGVYTVRFRLLKKGREDLSMGDRGFEKPARVLCRPDGCSLCLYPRQVKYRPLQHRTYLGRLSRLWYRDGEAWHEALPGADGGYVIPGAVVVRREEPTPEGRVFVRVRASVNQWTMPESEAELVFDLDSISPCGEGTDPGPSEGPQCIDHKEE